MALDQKLGELHVDLLAREEKFEQQLKDAEKKGQESGKKSGKKFGDGFANAAKRGMDKMAKIAGNVFKSIGRMATRTIKIGLVAAFAGATAAAFKFITTTAKFERLELRFTQLFGSVEEGKKQFEDLVKLAASTPFALEDLAEGVATMEAFHQGSSVLIESMGDLSVFLNGTVPEAAAAFGRAMAAGAGAADILRDRGVLNLVKLKAGVNDLTKLTLPQFRKALIDTMTDPNGRIAGGTRALANTLEGRWSTFKDKITEVFAIVGERMRADTTEKLDEWISALENFITSGKVEQLAEKVKAAFDIVVKSIEAASRALLKFVETDFRTGLPKDVIKRVQELQRRREALIKNIESQSAGSPQVLQLRAALAETERQLEEALKKIPFGPPSPGGQQQPPSPSGAGGGGTRRRAGSGDVDLESGAPKEGGRQAPRADPTFSQRFLDDMLAKFEELDAQARAKYQESLDFAEDKFAAMWTNILRIELQSENRLIQGFINMANAFIAEVERMIAKWLAFQAIKQFGRAFGVPLPDLPTDVTTAHYGADVTTPGNFVGEKVAVIAGPNERIQVTPSGRHGQGSEANLLGAVIKRLDILNMNITDMEGGGGDVFAKVEVKDRKLAQMVERSNRRDSRFR